MKVKVVLANAIVSAIALFGVFTASGTAQTPAGLTVNCATPTCLTQSITGTASNGDAVNLTSTVTRFTHQRGALLAVVSTTGTVGTQQVNQTSTVPVSTLAADPSCTILDLTLGPLHLNLLGLVVDLNQVHLTITGQTGPGNLLGNLLCGLANALNGSQAGGLSTLLNQILGAL
jgi:hypothetical protein